MSIQMIPGIPYAQYQTTPQPNTLAPTGQAPTLLPPSPHGFVQIAAEVKPGLAGRFSSERKSLLNQLKALSAQLEQQPGVEKANAFKAVLMPPNNGNGPRFDVVELIETDSPATAQALQGNSTFQAMQQAVQSVARQSHTLVASNIRRMGDVDRSRPGLFIFNFFQSQRPQGEVVSAWENEAKHYQDDAGLHNSLLLAPLQGTPSNYALVNHARWEKGLLHMMMVHMTKSSLRNDVPQYERQHQINSAPTVYRLA